MAKAHYEQGDSEGGMGARLFPSPTARDGKVRANSARTGIGQGRASPKRMIHCSKCGYVFNRNKTDVSGGKMIGDADNEPLGGLEKPALRTQTYTVGGNTFTDSYADVPVVSAGAGCPCCGTKNGGE